MSYPSPQKRLLKGHIISRDIWFKTFPFSLPKNIRQYVSALGVKFSFFEYKRIPWISQVPYNSFKNFMVWFYHVLQVLANQSQPKNLLTDNGSTLHKFTVAIKPYDNWCKLDGDYRVLHQSNFDFMIQIWDNSVKFTLLIQTRCPFSLNPTYWRRRIRKTCNKNMSPHISFNLKIFDFNFHGLTITYLSCNLNFTINKF